MFTFAGIVAVASLFSLAGFTFYDSDLSLKILWNVVVPVAPLIFLIAVNFWVSVCPFSFLQALPARFGLGGKVRLSRRVNTILGYWAWILLFLLVPLRHFLFDHVGLAAFVAIMGISLASLGSGMIFSGLSGWCTSLCPVKPVEFLYGQFSAYPMLPSHCQDCSGCTTSCARIKKTSWTGEKYAAFFSYMFPGFVTGFNLTVDEKSVLNTYLIIAAAMVASLAVFWILQRFLSAKVVLRLCAFGAFVIYYGFAIPTISRNLDLSGIHAAIIVAIVLTAVTATFTLAPKKVFA